ncbi:hypothetical protein Tco_0480106, partial [Tanacetum coccineum]
PIASPATAETEGLLTELGAQVQMQGGFISDHEELRVRAEEGRSDIYIDIETSVSLGVMGRSAGCTESSFVACHQ